MNVLEKILEEINKTEEEYYYEQHSPMFYMGACSMAADVKEIIRSHMDDAENDGWIPVSERLPEENGGYLTTVKELNYEEHVTISFFDKYDMRGWQHVHMLAEKVTAWKPLPEPYKGE